MYFFNRTSLFFFFAQHDTDNFKKNIHNKFNILQIIFFIFALSARFVLIRRHPALLGRGAGNWSL